MNFKKSISSFLIVLFYIVFLTTGVSAQTTALKTQDIVTGLETKYAIHLVYHDIPEATWKKVTYQNLTPDDRVDLKTYVQLFGEEFNKYPIDFIEHTGLKTIAFVKALQYDGQNRASIPDYGTETLFMDIDLGKYNKTYQRHVIHHEFYHLIEQKFNGNMRYKDPKWAAFNPPNFEYGLGGEYMRTKDAYGLTHPKPGFINLYATSGLEEDKAEMYAILFIPEEAKKVYSWAKDDPILTEKMDYLKHFLAQHSGHMDEGFWKGLLESAK